MSNYQYEGSQGILSTLQNELGLAPCARWTQRFRAAAWHVRGLNWGISVYARMMLGALLEEAYEGRISVLLSWSRHCLKAS